MILCASESVPWFYQTILHRTSTSENVHHDCLRESAIAGSIVLSTLRCGHFVLLADLYKPYACRRRSLHRCILYLVLYRWPTVNVYYITFTLDTQHNFASPLYIQTLLEH